MKITLRGACGLRRGVAKAFSRLFRGAAEPAVRKLEFAVKAGVSIDVKVPRDEIHHDDFTIVSRSEF
jgi:hypothetical protein